MQALCPLLKVFLLLASAAAQPAEVPSGWQGVLEQYAGLDPPGQQRWIRDLSARLNRANQLVLTPREAAAEQAREAMLLGQTARDRTVSRSELLELLRQTDQGEKAAIERLARRFRICVYDTFRLRRDEFAGRRAAWDRTLALWEAAGGPFEQQSRLIDWLEAAIRSSMPGSVAALPDVPNFGPLADVRRPIAPLRPGENREQPLPPPTRWEPLPPPRSVASIRPPAELPPATEQSAPVGIPPTEPASPGVASVAAGIGPRRDAGALAGITGQPVSNLPPADLPPVFVPPPAGTQRLPATDRAVAAANRAGQPPLRSVARAGPLLPKLDSLPPAASTAARPSPEQPPARPPHRVNLAELTTRIAGANLALQSLEAELDENGGWDARRLGPLVDRLGFLVLRHNDLELFRELVSAQERSSVGRLELPQTAIARLAARIFEARTHAGGPGSAGSEAQRRAELRELDELSRRLAEITSQK